YEEVAFAAAEDLTGELTGSIITDRARGIGYCGLGQRCDMAGAEAMHKAFGLKLTFCFDLAEGEYHTNVVMALLASRAVILAADGFADRPAPEAIARPHQGQALWVNEKQTRAIAGHATTVNDARTGSR